MLHQHKSDCKSSICWQDNTCSKAKYFHVKQAGKIYSYASAVITCVLALIIAGALSSCGGNASSYTSGNTSNTGSTSNANHDASVKSGDNITWCNNPWYVYGQANTTVPIPTSTSASFTLMQGERAPADISTVDRTEFVGQTKWNFGQDTWVEFDERVDEGVSITSSWLVIGQLHQTDDNTGRSPIFAQVLFNDNTLRLVAGTSPTSSGKTQTITLYQDNSFQRGVWYHWKYHFKITQGASDGIVECWRNGEQIVSYYGAIGYNNTVGPYWQMGAYRSTAPESVTVEYKNYMVTFGS